MADYPRDFLRLADNVALGFDHPLSVDDELDALDSVMRLRRYQPLSLEQADLAAQLIRAYLSGRRAAGASFNIMLREREQGHTPVTQ